MRHKPPAEPNELNEPNEPDELKELNELNGPNEPHLRPRTADPGHLHSFPRLGFDLRLR